MDKSPVMPPICVRDVKLRGTDNSVAVVEGEELGERKKRGKRVK